MDKAFIMSYSGGKDSAFALYKMIENGYSPKALFTVMRCNDAGSNGHRLSKQMLQSAADAMNIPIHFLDLRCDEPYDAQLSNLISAYRREGAQSCVFGDIGLEPSKARSQEICDAARITALFPLWQMDEEFIAREFISAGFKTVVKSVYRTFPENWLGRVFDEELIEDLRAQGASVCGENGEYHTFVFDGPLFSRPVSYKTGKTISAPPYKTIELFNS